MTTSEAPVPVADPDPSTADRAKACSQLLRQQERALGLLQRIIDEVDTSITRSLLKRLRSDGRAEVESAVGEMVAKVEDAVRAVQYCESEIHRELVAISGKTVPAGGPSNLPVALARFLAERRDSPGFTFEMGQDPVRGWTIRWKEYSEKGTVRGAGQFYERPYAWLEE
jgi:hypothetical protein